MPRAERSACAWNSPIRATGSRQASSARSVFRASRPHGEACLMDLAAASSVSNAGARLLGLLQGYRLEGFERAFKMVGGEILAERFLAGIHKAGIFPPALFLLCDKLGMPERFVDSFRENAQGANAFHFGFEGGAGSGLVKVYLEYAHHLGQAASHGASMGTPVLLHLAYKWDALDAGKSAVARY